MPPTNLQRLAFWSLAIGMATHGFAQPVINIPSLNQLPKPLRQAAKAQVRKEAPKPPIYSKLQRKWIVRNVERDGKPNAAQIGQKVGDIITIKQDGTQWGFG